MLALQKFSGLSGTTGKRNWIGLLLLYVLLSFVFLSFDFTFAYNNSFFSFCCHYINVSLVLIHLLLFRGMSSVHAIFITAMSLYFVFWSDLYSDQYNGGPITFRSSPLSTFALGVSVNHLFVLILQLLSVTNMKTFLYLDVSQKVF